MDPVLVGWLTSALLLVLLALGVPIAFALASCGMIGWFMMAMIVSLIAPFVSAAIYHVCLLIVGGAKRDYECTYRVVAYVTGSTAVFSVIPIIGMYIGGIWAIVCTIIGFSRAHGISGGRAALAYFLPIIVCCGLSIVIAILMAASIQSMPMPR